MATPLEAAGIYTSFEDAYMQLCGLYPHSAETTEGTLTILTTPNTGKDPASTEHTKVILSKPDLVIEHTIGAPNNTYPGLIRTVYSPRQIHRDPLTGKTWVQSMEQGIFNTYPRDRIYKRETAEWKEYCQEARSQALTIINNIVVLLR